MLHGVQHSATSQGGDHAHQVRRQGSRQRAGSVTDPLQDRPGQLARALLPGGLEGLRYEEFAALFPQVKREALHLEMRDSDGTETEIPHLANWAAGEPDDLGWLQPWCTYVRDATTVGKTF